MKPLYWCVNRLFKAYFKLFHGHTVYGLENIPEGRAIIAPNHTSFFDPPLISISMPEEISFLARKSLFSSPIFGRLISNLNAYPVSPSQELTSMKLICRFLAEGKKVVIFPEGSRSHDGNIQPIKTGIGMLALRGQAPIIPVYIHGAYSVWNRYHKFPKFYGKIVCIFGKPIDWEEFKNMEKKDAQEAIAHRVKTSIESLKAWYDNGAVGKQYRT